MLPRLALVLHSMGRAEGRGLISVLLALAQNAQSILDTRWPWWMSASLLTISWTIWAQTIITKRVLKLPARVLKLRVLKC
jgi:hypothetical protein